MKQMMQSWRHVFKLDPDRCLDDETIRAICTSSTDAIMVGGSSGVTYDNTLELLSRISRYELPCLLEVSQLDAVVPGFDGYMIPMVLNTGHPDWLLGHHVRAVEQFGDIIPWDKTIVEGYIILNPNCTAAKVSEAMTSISSSEAAAYAQVGDNMLQLPIVYIEYSGMFGDMELLFDVRRKLNNSRLFYGGGIVDGDTARKAFALCDTIVVGNVIYEDLVGALATVDAVKPH